MSKTIAVSRRLLIGMAALVFSLSAYDAQAQQPTPLKLGVTRHHRCQVGPVTASDV